jgi:hypothetical protein
MTGNCQTACLSDYLSKNELSRHSITPFEVHSRLAALPGNLGRPALFPLEMDEHER